MATENRWIDIDLPTQQLFLRDDSGLLQQCSVSTAKNGPGERLGSGCTPRGRHCIRLKIGQGCAPGTVFVARRPTGELYSAALGERHPERDWILTRILWLTGLEPGLNRGGDCDTLRRFVYIHGCPPDAPMGVPGSHGCIRMRDDDLIALFDAISTGARVNISA